MQQSRRFGWEAWYHVDQSLHVSPTGQRFWHLRVRRVSGKDGIAWDTLQQIKNDMWGPDVVAIEIYPATHALVNETNTRHLFAVDAPSIIEKLPNLSSR